MTLSNFCLSTLAILTLTGCSPENGDTGSSTSAVPSPESKAISAHVVYTNGRIYTVNEAQPWAEALAVIDGRIVAIGTSKDVASTIGENTKVIDLAGNFAMPGVVDLHSHPFITPWYGAMNLSLVQGGNPDAILAEVAAYASANPDKEWIIGGQWAAGIFPNDSPNKELLDEIVSDRPVALLDNTGHSMWLNSKAMELAGINADSPTSNLIIIDKDPETREPTGTVREQAIQIVEQSIPQATPEVYAPHIKTVMDMFKSYGITSQQTAEGHRGALDALKLLEKDGQLEQRMYISWDWKTTLNLAYSVEDIEGQIENRAIYESDLVYPNYVKIYGDGSPSGRSALLLEPYSNDLDFYGDANMSVEEFAEAFIKFDNMGVGVHIHVTGDGTAERVVEAFEIMRAKNGDSGVRHKMAHNFLTNAEQFNRLGQLSDMAVDFSPPMFHPHAAAEGAFRPASGDRMEDSHAVRKALDAGLHVGQGSDWQTLNPTPDPLIALESMVTRQNPFDPEMTGTLGPENAVTLEEAIMICTLGGAAVIGAENDIGSLATGKFADMIVLDQNLFEIKPTDIYDSTVLMTIVGGKVVYTLD